MLSINPAKMGVYTALPPNPAAPAPGGTGSGAKVNIAWSNAYISGARDRADHDRADAIAGVYCRMDSGRRCIDMKRPFIVLATLLVLALALHRHNRYCIQRQSRRRLILAYVVNNWYLPLAMRSQRPARPQRAPIPWSVDMALLMQAITLNALGSRITTLHAGGNVQFAIYNNGSWGRPSTLVAATASITTAAAGTVSAAIAAPIPPGSYWFCQNTDDATAVLAAQAANSNASPYLGSASQGSSGTAGDANHRDFSRTGV